MELTSQEFSLVCLFILFNGNIVSDDTTIQDDTTDHLPYFDGEDHIITSEIIDSIEDFLCKCWNIPEYNIILILIIKRITPEHSENIVSRLTCTAVERKSGGVHITNLKFILLSVFIYFFTVTSGSITTLSSSHNRIASSTNEHPLDVNHLRSASNDLKQFNEYLRSTVDPQVIEKADAAINAFTSSPPPSSSKRLLSEATNFHNILTNKQLTGFSEALYHIKLTIIKLKQLGTFIEASPRERVIQSLKILKNGLQVQGKIFAYKMLAKTITTFATKSTIAARMLQTFTTFFPTITTSITVINSINIVAGIIRKPLSGLLHKLGIDDVHKLADLIAHGGKRKKTRSKQKQRRTRRRNYRTTRNK